MLIHSSTEQLLKKLEKVALNWTGASFAPSLAPFALRLISFLYARADNISTAMCHIRDNHGEQARDQFKEQLGITDDFEDLSFP